MLSFKIYQSLIRPNIGAKTLRNYRKIFDTQIINSPHRCLRVYKYYTSSNIAKLSIYGLAGSVVTYVSCAIWEYENNRSNVTRRSFFKTQFANIFGRPLKSSDIFWVIAGINLAIFATFKLSPKFDTIIMKFFLHTKSDPPALLMSIFTHILPFHLFINMYVLHSFSSQINYFGAPHFIAVYITGGIVSGLATVAYKTMTKSIKSSIGASGSILVMLSIFGTLRPDLRFGIPFISDLTNISFSAKHAIGGILLVDIFCLIFLKSSRIDHVCHISGVLFGIFYGLIGKQIFWESRKTWMSWYYSFRAN